MVILRFSGHGEGGKPLLIIGLIMGFFNNRVPGYLKIVSFSKIYLTWEPYYLEVPEYPFRYLLPTMANRMASKMLGKIFALDTEATAIGRWSRRQPQANNASEWEPASQRFNEQASGCGKPAVAASQRFEQSAWLAS
jgi:hypothetical protein